MVDLIKIDYIPGAGMEDIKILLADDDPEDRMIMEDSFREMHLLHIIHCVESGERIIEFLESKTIDDNLPSLIILDLNMPLMNGTQTLKAIKNIERFCRIPVMIFSTSVNPFEMNECMKTGAESYIVKPGTYKECQETARFFYDYTVSGSLV